MVTHCHTIESVQLTIAMNNLGYSDGFTSCSIKMSLLLHWEKKRAKMAFLESNFKNWLSFVGQSQNGAP